MARQERGSAGPDPASKGPVPGAAELDIWYFGVRLGEGRYAFLAPLVTEVVRLGPLTRLPAAPTFLPGVFTHRGEILPVLDLSELLLRRAVSLRPGVRAAIVHAEPWRVAVVADEMEGLLHVPRRRVGPPPAGHAVRDFLQAVVPDDLGDIAVIDLPRLVAAARARSAPA